MPRSRTKAIAETAGATASPKDGEALSVVGRSASLKALTPRQAYESNLHARKAVNSIAENVAKAHRRLFSRRTGEEIVSGDAFNFVRDNLTVENIKRLISWFNIEGEVACWKVPGGTGLRPQKLIVLDPGKLVTTPPGLRNLEALNHWDYLDGWALGPQIRVQLPADQVIFGSNFNPNHPFRGLSPASAGVMEISTNYFAGRFNAAHFQNGCHRDLIVRFPKGTNKDVARDWIKRWEQQHSIYQGNAFKIAAVIGDELQIEEPGSTARDGQFMELRKLNSEDIGALWGVPAAVMGFYGKTRFDSIDGELEMFAENVLMPQMGMLTELIQKQLLDPHFTSSNTKKVESRLSPGMRKALDRAIAENPQSDVVFLLDPDTLPIASKLRVRQLEMAQKFQQTMAVSFATAAEWAGVDRPSNEADNLIYLPSNLSRVDTTTQKQVADLTAKLADLESRLAEKDTAPTLDEAQRAKLADLKAFAREYRALVLDRVANDGRFDKAAAEALAAKHDLDGDQRVKVLIAQHHLAVRGITKQTDQTDERVKRAKALLNEFAKPATLKSLL